MAGALWGLPPANDYSVDEINRLLAKKAEAFAAGIDVSDWEPRDVTFEPRLIDNVTGVVIARRCP